MFLVKTYKKWHQAVNLLDVESVLMFYIYDLSVEEVGILAIAFFKTFTVVKNINLVELMYNKLETRIDDVDPLTLTAFLKVGDSIASCQISNVASYYCFFYSSFFDSVLIIPSYIK